MLRRIFQRSETALLLSAVCYCAIGTFAFAHEGHKKPARGRSPITAEPAPSRARSGDRRSVSLSERPPHGGQISEGAYHHFEVVYRPQETRIYLYDPKGQPVAARGVKGEVVMQVQGSPKQHRFPLSYASPKPGTRDSDYLLLPVDVSGIPDGEMQVRFELSNLPFQDQEPRARFSQTFALTHAPLSVTVAKLTAADKPGIARQRVCPVMDTPLGSHGEVIKVLVGRKPLYLCCKGCIRKVQANPELYLQKAYPENRAASRSAARAQVSVVKATAADRGAIKAQRVCPVTNQPLGAHGTPLKVTVGSRSLFVCCRGCVGKVEKDFDYYLAQNTSRRSTR